MTTRVPQLAEVISVAIRSKIRDVHVAIPARVESYDKVRQTVDVQPMIMDVDTDDDGGEIKQTLPIINRVPVMFPRGGSYFITWPIAKGDFVQLVFNERSIDQYAESAGGASDAIVDPVHTHSHDLSDAVAFPGMYPFKKSIADIDDVNMVLGKDVGKSKVIIKDASIEVRSPGGTTLVIDDTSAEVRVTGAATMRLTGKDSTAAMVVGDGAVHTAIYEHLSTFWSTFKIWADTHIHPTGMGPSGPTVAPAPSLPANIKSNKISFPDG